MGKLYRDPKGTLLKCKKCGGTLIERLPNGLWKFKFGKSKKYIPSNGEQGLWNPVLMYVHGSVKMRCFRSGCGHWNIFNYLPNVNLSQETESDYKKNKGGV